MGQVITIEDLGGELRRRREELGLSLREVADATEVSAATLSRVERGQIPERDVASKLARWLDVTIQTSAARPQREGSDEDLKRTIEVHLRASKKIPANLARSIANSFDFVMRVELERAKTKKR